jgi:hypothetical protein
MWDLPSYSRACVLDFGVIQFCIPEEISVFTYPVVRGDGQTVTCSLGIVVDSKLFANLAPHPSGFLSIAVQDELAESINLST